MSPSVVALGNEGSLGVRCGVRMRRHDILYRNRHILVSKNETQYRKFQCQTSQAPWTVPGAPLRAYAPRPPEETSGRLHASPARRRSGGADTRDSRTESRAAEPRSRTGRQRESRLTGHFDFALSRDIASSLSTTVHFLLNIDTECHDETCDEMLTITLTYPVSASRELSTHVRSVT
jgi:hypothetical protein